MLLCCNTENINYQIYHHQIYKIEKKVPKCCEFGSLLNKLSRNKFTPFTIFMQ